jgi:thymidylate synthase
MHKELLPVYPELQIGAYTMFVNNVHIYERNFNIFKNMINDYKNGNFENQDILSNITKENLNYV